MRARSRRARSRVARPDAAPSVASGPAPRTLRRFMTSRTIPARRCAWPSPPSRLRRSPAVGCSARAGSDAIDAARGRPADVGRDRARGRLASTATRTGCRDRRRPTRSSCCRWRCSSASVPTSTIPTRLFATGARRRRRGARRQPVDRGPRRPRDRRRRHGRARPGRSSRPASTRVRGRVFGATGPFARDWWAPGWRDYFPRLYIALPTALTYRGNELAGGRHVTRSGASRRQSAHRRSSSRAASR